MNYTKQVVHFARMFTTLQTTASSSSVHNSSVLLQPLQPSSVLSNSFRTLTNAMESDILYSHIDVEPTTFHGLQFQEDFGGMNGSDQTNVTLTTPSTFSIVQVFWTVMFSTMLSLACLGNIVVIWIVLAHRRMRTVTNYFLLNLSVADLTMASLNGAPNFIYMLHNDWIFGSVLCVVNNFVANFTVASCVFTMTAISLDRYMAIVRPLHPRMTKGTAWRAIGAIWLCSAILALPCLLYSTTQTFGKTTKTQCFLQWPDGNPDESNLDFGYTICLLILTYVIPMTAMGICYGSMSKELWGHRQIGEVTERQINAMISKRKVVRMFIVIVFLFAVCWAPYHLYFIYIYYDGSIVYKKWVQSLFLSFYLIAMSTSMVNPIIYYFMNTRFRNYIREIAKNFFFCHRRASRSRSRFVGETPPLFRRYSQSYSRSRSGTGEDNMHIPRHVKSQHNLVLQNHLHCHHHPIANHAQVSVGNRHHAKRLQGVQSPYGKRLQQNAMATCNTYC